MWPREMCRLACRLPWIVATAWALGGSAPISDKSLIGCTFEVVTVDDRPLPQHVGGFDSKKFWGMTALINNHYCQRWTYSYRYVQLNSSAMPQYHPTWGKVFYVAERLREIPPHRCHWILFLDSDAFVRSPDLPLPAFLADLGKRFGIPADVGAIFAREEDPDPLGDGLSSWMRKFKPSAPWLNAGVFLVQSGRNGRLLFDIWEKVGRDIEPFFKTQWPGEMAVITELVTPGLYPSARVAPRHDGSSLPDLDNRTVGIVPMVVMNSPWGRFVLHAWSYHDYYRDTVFWDALVRIRCDGPKVLTRQLGVLTKRSTELWGPSADAIGGIPRRVKRS